MGNQYPLSGSSAERIHSAQATALPCLKLKQLVTGQAFRPPRPPQRSNDAGEQHARAYFLAAWARLAARSTDTKRSYSLPTGSVTSLLRKS